MGLKLQSIYSADYPKIQVGECLVVDYNVCHFFTLRNILKLIYFMFGSTIMQDMVIFWHLFATINSSSR